MTFLPTAMTVRRKTVAVHIRHEHHCNGTRVYPICFGSSQAETFPVEVRVQRVNDINIMLKPRLRANYKTGYWEVIFLHTKPLGLVPAEMRARG